MFENVIEPSFYTQFHQSRRQLRRLHFPTQKNKTHKSAELDSYYYNANFNLDKHI